MIRGHYLLWIIIMIAFMGIGALFRGQNDIIREKAMEAGQMSVIVNLPLRALSEVNVRKI